MLLGMDHGFKLFAVGSLIFHGSLGYDLPSVESGIHEMDADAVDFHPVFHCLSDGVGSTEGRKERRMDVDDSSRVGIEQHVADDAHVARQADQVDAFFFEMAKKHRLECLFRIIILRTEFHHRYAMTCGALSHVGPGLVGDAKRHLGIDPSVGTGLRQCLEIGAVSAGEYGYLLFHSDVI